MTDEMAWQVVVLAIIVNLAMGAFEQLSWLICMFWKKAELLFWYMMLRSREKKKITEVMK